MAAFTGQLEKTEAGLVRKRSDDVFTVIDSDNSGRDEGISSCYDEIASCPALIEVGGMDCSRSGARDFCRESCQICSDGNNLKELKSDPFPTTANQYSSVF